MIEITLPYNWFFTIDTINSNYISSHELILTMKEANRIIMKGN